MSRDLMSMIQAKQDMGCGAQANAPYNPTLRERLIAQKADLTQRLANVTNAIEALDANPNFEQVLDVIGKVNY